MKIIEEYVKDKKELIKEKVSSLKGNLKLGIIQVNEDQASNAYVRGKLKDCAEVGIVAELIKLPVDVSQDELLAKIDELNNDNSFTGFIVQMPLPKGIDTKLIENSVRPSKDVDGFNPLSSYDPATPKGIIRYLDDMGFDYNGKNAVVIGRSDIVGRPMHKLLLDRNMNVTVLHSRTSKEDKKFYIEHADLIVVAIGKAYEITNEYNFKEGAIVFDVGINRNEEGKLCGDCIPNLNVKFQSPVPKGVGLITRLSLIENLIESYKYNN